MKERKYEVGQHVIYVDKFGKPRDALVTIWWLQQTAYQPETPAPGCNLVFVSGDERKDDSCGRQTERETSVVHRSNQPAHGNFWCWPDEL
jgi:hypothetical protein